MAESSMTSRLHRPLLGLLHLTKDLVLRAHKKLRPNPVQIPDELIWEILTWVPAKSLMRFKCVSRIWRSIITNPSFCKAFRGGSPGLFACMPLCLGQLSKRFFYFAALDGSPTSQVLRYLIADHGGEEMGATGIVNGLICFYYCNRSSLYNIATRESLLLPLSKNESKACRYHLGFDPINKLYKLLKTCPVYDHRDEILTIGVDLSWRVVVDSLPMAIESAGVADSLPPMTIESEGVCMDGAIYWTERKGISSALIAFNLIEEKYKFIPRPEERGFSTLKFAPGLALCELSTIDWTSLASVIYYGGGWSDELKFILSTKGESDRNVEGILPGGKLVITERSHALFLFDPIKREYEKIVLLLSDECYSCEYFDDFYGKSSYYEENL